MPIKRKTAPPEPCTCGREPVLVKARGLGYMYACPGVRDCPNCNTSGWHPTELDALEAWDRLIAELKKKGVRK